MSSVIYNFAAPALALWQQSGGQLDPQQFESGTTLFWTFVRTMLVLGFVCGLAYVVMRVVLPRLNLPGARGGMVRIVERAPLDGRRTLYVIEVAGRWLLVSSSDAGVQLISELEAGAAEERAGAVKAAALAAGGTRPAPGTTAGGPALNSFADVLARAISRKR